MSELEGYMMQELADKKTVAQEKKELLDFTVRTLRYEGVISDESMNQWSKINIYTTSFFDGISDIYSWWQYGLQWKYVQIPMKTDVIKLKAHLGLDGIKAD